MGHGFISSAFSKGVMGSLQPDIEEMGRLGRAFLAGVVGGTSSQLSGGKFANGALTAALAQLYNQDGGSRELERDEWPEFPKSWQKEGAHHESNIGSLGSESEYWARAIKPGTYVESEDVNGKRQYIWGVKVTDYRVSKRISDVEGDSGGVVVKNVMSTIRSPVTNDVLVYGQLDIPGGTWEEPLWDAEFKVFRVNSVKHPLLYQAIRSLK